MSAHAESVFEYGAEEMPFARGWSYEKGTPYEEPWSDQASHGGTHALRAQGKGQWLSPPFTVTRFNWYRLDFFAKAEKPGHWAALFYDADGKDTPDHYSLFDASTDWAGHTFYFRAKANAVSCRILFHPSAAGENDPPIFIDDVKVRTISREEVADWADGLHADVGSVAVVPDPERWNRIPRAAERLRQGGVLRVVMLGDSIVNDTGNSPWEVLAEKLYPPGTKLEVVTAVRGSTGCWYYKDENRVRAYVTDFRPDLVMIGGISNRGNVEAIASVVEQIKAWRPETEFLFMTGPCGRHGDPRNPEYAALDPKLATYRERLFAYVEERGYALLDIEMAWRNYMAASSKPYPYFMRDELHCNERGRQVLARVLREYFSALK
ncbi:MAG: SGNH/GDSL hydrolase family protein [Planctomycetota bacterium]|nr:SGNH/GDSL hydrolase family protein [Planctomycetota bacterium]